MAALDYVRYVLAKMGMKPAALAKLAGLATTTLTRPLNDDGFKYTLSTTTLDRIREATGYDYAPFLSSEMDSIQRTLDMFKRDDYYGDAKELPAGEESGSIAVMGEVAAGVWREVQFASDELLYVLFLAPTQPSWKGNTIGLIVRGESLNKIARENDILVVESIAQSGGSPRDGDLVVVERRRDQDGIIEMTAKRLSGGKLLPESNDPRYQTPLELGEHENEIVQIIGIVHYIVRVP